MTFSLAARCPRTGAFGIAISSSSPAVAARCSHLRAGIGVAASQNVTDPRLGFRLLDLVQDGRCAADAITDVIAGEPTADYRQLTVVDTAGRTAAHSGRYTLGTHHVAHGPAAVAAGNLLATSEVVDALLQGYLASAAADFAGRLLDGLDAALRAGGEAGPVRSAGLAVADPVAGWNSTDLRVDWHADPISELRRLWDIWLPQRDDYLTRGLNPQAAPGFGGAAPP